MLQGAVSDILRVLEVKFEKQGGWTQPFIKHQITDTAERHTHLSLHRNT